ncbi:MAG: hypothetical protein WC841_00955 [Candidatus Shapirobacteria bacterium]|jgi:hypothetical protein
MAHVLEILAGRFRELDTFEVVSRASININHGSIGINRIGLYDLSEAMTVGLEGNVPIVGFGRNFQGIALNGSGSPIDSELIYRGIHLAPGDRVDFIPTSPGISVLNNQELVVRVLSPDKEWKVK